MRNLFKISRDLQTGRRSALLAGFDVLCTEYAPTPREGFGGFKILGCTNVEQQWEHWSHTLHAFSSSEEPLSDRVGGCYYSVLQESVNIITRLTPKVFLCPAKNGWGFPKHFDCHVHQQQPISL